MKKVLLTTTALVMTAGVASAEITFSGSGEAGFYRTGKVSAAAAKAGVNTSAATVAGAGNVDNVTAADATKYGGTAADTGTYNYDADTNLLTLTKATGDAADAEAADIEDALEATFVANSAVANAEAALANLGGTYTVAQKNQLTSNLAAAKAAQAAANAAYAATLGSAAVEASKASDMKAYSGYDFNVAVSGASDNGMTFAMGFDMGAGHIADQDDDREMDEQAEEIATSAMTIGYMGYTIEIGDEKVDDLYDADGWNADVSLAGSFGDLTFKVATDMDSDVAGSAAKFTAEDGATTDADYTAAKFTAAVEAEYNPTSYSIGYSMGDMSFSLAGTEHDAFGNAAMKYSLTAKVLPSLSATLSSDDLGSYKDVGKLAVTYTVSDAMTLTASVKDDKDHALNTNKGGKQSNDFSIAYAAGALSATVASDESSNWWVNAKYDLGAGATAFTTFDHSEFLVAGVNFSF